MSNSAASSALRDLEQQFLVQSVLTAIGKAVCSLNELGHGIRPRVEALLEQARSLEQAFGAASEAWPSQSGGLLEYR